MRDDLLDAIPVLASLEGCAAKLAAKKLKPKTLIKLNNVNIKLKKSLRWKRHRKLY